MNFKNNNKEKIIKFFNGKGFYVVAALSLIAIGAAAWTAVSSLKDFTNNEQTESNTSKNQYSQYAELNSETESKVPATESSKKEITQNTSSEKGEIVQSANTTADFFIMPISGGEIMKGFSDTELQFSHTFSDFRIHKAVDIKADKDTPVYACGKGKVSEIVNDAMLGTVIKIDHGNSIFAHYCGLNSNTSVKVGDIVDSSMIIGAVSVIPSESVEQSHLHLEFYKDGKAISPTDYITN